MRYKVGDKVKIRDDLNDTEEYWMEDGTSSNHANDDMVRLKSKIRTIVDIDGGQYKLAGNDWHWTDEMFEGKIAICKLPAFSFKLEKDKERLEKKLKIVEAMVKGVNVYPADEEKENKNNKEDIEMSNTQLIENKLEKELDALKKARNEEVENKFYETTLGKAAKAFNEALEQHGNENQKEYSMIDIDELIERSEENFFSEIYAKYDIKRQETKEYYAEALGLFENADTYEQKHEILTSYGILKGPKATKAKVEVK